MRSWRVVVVLLALEISVQAQEGRLGEIVRGLKGEKKQREAAMEALEKWAKEGLSTDVGIAMLRAAAAKFPPHWEGNDYTGAAALIDAAARRPKAAYVEVIAELFPKYDLRARWEALYLLAVDREEIPIACLWSRG